LGYPNEWKTVFTAKNGKKAGFTIEGKLCKESYVNGAYRDEYSMALFPS
jgi:hypothetical protein